MGTKKPSLKKQIMKAFPDSMLAYILREHLTEVIECRTFQEIASLIRIFPDQIQQDYALAYDFSEFLYVLRTVYNIIVSDGKNKEANMHWDELFHDLKKLSSVDLECIFGRLGVSRNILLCNFLRKSQKLMRDADLEGMKAEIKRRERELKQSRAKTMHPGEVNPNTWYGGGLLDYRYGNAKVIIRDIFESEENHVKSE